ncbi:MAG: LacI family transcriptional regulator [Phycisphaerae bacterium]|nr:LacI family transcriptional regulator [Phycisphaerae bacterium]
MRVTLKHIAKEAGVDVSTVSRVLNKKGRETRISPKRESQILEAARQLRYIPNSSARAVRTGRFDCAALLLSTHLACSYMPSFLLEGIHDELAKRDMHLTLAKLPDEKLSSEGYVPKILRSMMADGLLIDYTHQLPAQLEDIIKRRSIPAVWLNTKHEMDCVYPDNLEAGRRATQYLLKMGHRRIAYADYFFGYEDVAAAHYSAVDRCRGYEQAMRQAGLEPRTIRADAGRVPAGLEEVEFTKRWMSEPNRPTAVIAYWMTIALPIRQAALEMGLSVPKNLSILTFASESSGNGVLLDSGFNITAMVEPEQEMGRTAVQMLLEKIEKPSNALASKVLNFKLEEVGSCCPPSGKEH